MIVWGGGGVTTGGRYNPISDSWLQTESETAPTARSGHSAVWTGKRMVVWGGRAYSGDTDTGGRYDPVTDTWSPMNFAGAPSVREQHTDQLRKLPNDFRIFGIASKRRDRHPQMILDEELHQLTVRSREPEAFEDLPRHSHALRRVLLVAPLPDIVEEQRQHEQLRRPEIGEQRGEMLATRCGGRGETLEVANRQQGVLVDRVLVIEIPHDAA